MWYNKTCLLCEQVIKKSQRLCKQHYTEYAYDMEQPWFKALVSEQARQEEIDRRECFTLPYNSATDMHGQYEKPNLLAKRNVGRPSTAWTVVNRVLLIYDKSLEAVELGLLKRPKSLRNIAKEVDDTIDHCTVRNILKTYRNNDKKQIT